MFETVYAGTSAWWVENLNAMNAVRREAQVVRL
jgi:hypothetical protein